MNRTLMQLTLVLGFSLAPSAGLAKGHQHDLARVVPEDALLYVGWSGAAAVSSAVQETALHRMLAEPQMKRCTTTIAAELKTFLGRQAAAGGQQDSYNAAVALLASLWKYPVALALLDAKPTETGPDIQLALLVHSGSDTEDVVGQFQLLVQTLGLPAPAEIELEEGRRVRQLTLDPTAPPVVFAGVGEYFLITLGSHTFEHMARSLGGGTHLADAPACVQARKKLGLRPERTLLSVFVDARRCRQVYDAFSGAPEDVKTRTDDMLRAMGLDSVRSISMATEVFSAGYQTSLLVYTAGEKRGLQKLWDQAAIADQDLAVVPYDASLASVFNLDLVGLYDEVLAVSQKLDQSTAEADAKANVEQTVRGVTAAVDAFLELNLRDDLLAALGDTMVIFDAPSNGGFLITGLTAVVEVRDARKIDQSLSKIVTRLGGLAGPGQVGIKSYSYNDEVIRFINFVGWPIPVAPAWALSGDRLVMGMYPQMVGSVLDHLKDPGASKSILDNQDFIRGRKLLAGDPVALSYIDTRKGLADVYAVLLPLAQAGLGMLQAEGLELDVSLLPSRGLVLRHMFGDVFAVYSDEDGILWRGHGPLPLSVPGLSGSDSVTSTAMLVSILLPSLARARELAKRTVSATNIKALRSAMNFYANDHNGRFPPDLQTLVDMGLISTEALYSPLDDSDQVSYVYVENQNSEDHARNVLLYERPDISKEGLNVGFIDGTVMWLKPEAFDPLLQQTAKRLGRRYTGPPVPESE